MAFNHPLIMVGRDAQRWMGIPVLTDKTFDILVRTSQATSIYQALIRSGEWLEVDDFVTGGELQRPVVQRLRRYDRDRYINLCNEDSYHLKVDTEKIQVPHIFTYNAVLMESQFHPDASHRTCGPRLIADKNIRFVPEDEQMLTIQIFIPTIPQFLDSCFDRIQDEKESGNESFFEPEIDIDNFVRYLLIDLPQQHDKLLAQVNNRKNLAAYLELKRERQKKRLQAVENRRQKYVARRIASSF
ncbi:hypothetical protein K440DRAFT_662723 [Wilcoxina mikolae CBS 423.85]|nr:hypothetical protein K440DRAFT_662723 [Wilcoxina mikolae CBS 423.85]